MKHSRLLCALALISCLTAAAVAEAFTQTEVRLMMNRINAKLEAQDAGYVLGVIEWITDADSDEVGSTVVFTNRGNRHLGADFVPGDARRAWGYPTMISDDFCAWDYLLNEPLAPRVSARRG